MSLRKEREGEGRQLDRFASHQLTSSSSSSFSSHLLPRHARTTMDQSNVYRSPERPSYTPLNFLNSSTREGDDEEGGKSKVSSTVPSSSLLFASLLTPLPVYRSVPAHPQTLSSTPSSLQQLLLDLLSPSLLPPPPPIRALDRRITFLLSSLLRPRSLPSHPQSQRRPLQTQTPTQESSHSSIEPLGRPASCSNSNSSRFRQARRPTSGEGSLGSCHPL